MVSRELEKECIVVFDEAHNIDNVCIEARPPPGPGRREGGVQQLMWVFHSLPCAATLLLSGQSATDPAAQTCASAPLLCSYPHGTCPETGAAGAYVPVASAHSTAGPAQEPSRASQTLVRARPAVNCALVKGTKAPAADLRTCVTRVGAQQVRTGACQEPSRARQTPVRARAQALSVTMRKHTLEAAARNVLKLRQAVDKCKATDANRLTTEYNRLVAGLQVRGVSDATQPRLNQMLTRVGARGAARSAYPGTTSAAAGGRRR